MNLSNHPSAGWTAAQRDAALELAAPLLDLRFPAVPAPSDLQEVLEMAHRLVGEVPAEVTCAMVAGEYVLCMAVVALLQARGVRCVAACSERDSVPSGDGQKRVVFRFVRLRDYPPIVLRPSSREPRP